MGPQGLAGRTLFSAWASLLCACLAAIGGRAGAQSIAAPESRFPRYAATSNTYTDDGTAVRVTGSSVVLDLGGFDFFQAFDHEYGGTNGWMSGLGYYTDGVPSRFTARDKWASGS